MYTFMDRDFEDNMKTVIETRKCEIFCPLESCATNIKNVTDA